jgi:hypothetical protein
MEKLFGIEPEPTPKPPVAIVNGKWSYYDTPVSQLDQSERQLVFNEIIKAVNFEQDRTNSLTF